MKRILLTLAIAVVSLTAITSCTKEYITNNNYLPGITYTTTIIPEDWVRTETGSNIWMAELDFPELDSKYYNYGTVQVAFEFTDSKGYFNTIPATIKDIHYSYDYSIGAVTIFAEDRALLSTNALDKSIKVKITLTDADNGGN